MNLFQNGRIDGMSMREPFFKGSLLVIRPLMLVEKSVIAKAARGWDLPVWSNPCPSAGATRRSEVMAELENIWRHGKNTRRKTVNGLIRWQLAKHLAGPSGPR
jgi:tRNA(Ile)-lysidine synthase TilS/MesJ